jgi:hypothetical protein
MHVSLDLRILMAANMVKLKVVCKMMGNIDKVYYFESVPYLFLCNLTKISYVYNLNIIYTYNEKYTRNG